MGQVAARAIGQKIRIGPLHGDAAHKQRDLLFAGARYEPHTVFKKFASFVAAVSLSVLSSAASSAASRSIAAS
jgi:hypothetical protein